MPTGIEHLHPLEQIEFLAGLLDFSSLEAMDRLAGMTDLELKRHIGMHGELAAKNKKGYDEYMARLSPRNQLLLEAAFNELLFQILFHTVGNHLAYMHLNRMTMVTEQGTETVTASLDPTPVEKHCALAA